MRAGVWVLGGHACSQIIRLGSNLIMTRLLIPEMFGIMAVANVLLTGIALFSDLGLRQNVIQSKRGDDPVFLNTVWTVQIVRGILIWLVAFSIAVGLHTLVATHMALQGTVYSEPVLPFIVGIISFNAVINGFESTKIALANRKFNLGLVTRIEIFSQLSGVVFMISWALVDRSIWAIVAGSILSSFLRMLASHVFLPGSNNKLHWDQTAFSEIFNFGKWIFLTSILGFLAANGDRLLLGGLVSSKVLGLYAIAFLLMSALQAVFSKVIGNVAFPVLSEVARERPAELVHIYYKIRLPVDAISSFITGFLFMTGHLIVSLLYDDRYLQAGQMFEILILALFMERFSLVGQCFVALGKPKLLVPVIVVRIVTLFLLLPVVFSSYGIEGSLWVIACSRFSALPIIFYLKAKYHLLILSREIPAILFLGIGICSGWFVNWLVAPHF